MRGHLTPREAGEHARAADVKSVLLTHISDEMDELWARREAEAGFGGPVHIATEGAVFNI
jgi:ribonuclease BN (tRNA processing enzyme)